MTDRTLLLENELTSPLAGSLPRLLKDESETCTVS